MAFLEVPYVFHGSGIRTGCRITETLALSSTTILRVPEIDGRDSPVVAKCRYPALRLAINNDGAFCWQDSELETDYRLRDGHLLRRMVVDKNFLFGNDWHHAPGLENNRARYNRHLQSWIDEPCSIGVESASSALAILRQSMQHGVHPILLTEPGRRPRELEIIPKEISPFSRNFNNDSLESVRITKSKLDNQVCLIDGALYLPSRGPGWRLFAGTEQNPGYIQALPEMGWLHGLEFVDVFMSNDSLLMAENQTRYSAQHRIGELLVLEPGNWQPHPDEFLSRGTAHDIQGSNVAEAFCKGGFSRGLYALGDVIELENSSESCGDELGKSLDVLATQLDRVFNPDEANGMWARIARRPADRSSLRNQLEANHVEHVSPQFGR